MNMLNVSRVNSYSRNNTYTQAQSFNFVDGNVYSAKVTERSGNRLKLMLENGTQFEAAFSDDMNVNIGDDLSLKANRTEAGFSLQILNNGSGNKAELDADQTKELFKQSGLISEENIFEIKSAWETDENAENIDLAISRIQAKLSSASNNLTLSAINELLSSGVSIQNLNLNVLNSVLKDVSESPEALSENEINEIIDGYMEKYGLSPEASDGKDEIIKHLSENNLPATEENVEFIEKCLKLFEGINIEDDGSIAALLSQDNDLTLLDLYKSGLYPMQKNENADMELLDKEISKLFSNECIEDNGENRRAAEFLYEYDLPITKENIDKLKFIESLKDSGAKEDIMKSAVNAIKNGNSPENTIVFDSSARKELENTYSKLLEDIPKLTEKHIAYASYTRVPVTLNSLRSMSIPSDFSYSGVGSSSKLHLYEVQLRLTSQSASWLSSKGINIDTMPLAKAVEALKQAEKGIYQGALEDAGVKPNPGNTSRMDDIFSSLRQLSQTGAGFYSSVISKNTTAFTVSEANSYRASGIIESYESSGSNPDSSYGDSFNDVKDQFKALLENMGIEASEENLKAARMLSRTGTEINLTSIMQVRIIDMKIDKVQKGLHPQIAADMIKEGFDMLNANIDDVINYIDEYNDEFGNNVKDNIAEYIYDMEKSGALDDKTRQSVIALYRLFNKISSESSGSISLNISAGHQATLKNLLDASGFLSADMDFEISDDEDIEVRRSGIRQSLSEAKTQEEYNERLAKSIEDALNMNNISELVENRQLWSLPVAELVDYLENYSAPGTANADKAAAMLEKVNEYISGDPNVFAFLESAGLPATLNNVKAYQELSKPGMLTKTISSINEGLDDDGALETEKADEISESTVSDNLSQLSEEAEKKVLDSGKASLLREVRLLQNGIKVQNAISKRSNSYRIPVNISGKESQLNMYMPLGYIPSGSSLDVALSIDMPGVNIKAMCNISGGKNTISLQCSSPGKEEQLKEAVSGALQNYGFTNNDIYINNGESIPEQSESEMVHGSWAKADRESLFNLAKAIMQAADNL